MGLYAAGPNVIVCGVGDDTISHTIANEHASCGAVIPSTGLRLYGAIVVLLEPVGVGYPKDAISGKSFVQ